MASSNRGEHYCFQYAAKFICASHIPGTSQTSDAVLPGNYQTCVNIHNPHDTKFKIRMKLAASNELISAWITDGLVGDGVVRVTCDKIKKFELRLIHGFEGFLVIESPCSLDVIAVYTAGGKEGVASIAVEQVKERLLCV